MKKVRNDTIFCVLSEEQLSNFGTDVIQAEPIGMEDDQTICFLCELKEQKHETM